ncbi:Mob1/phocein family protein, partial [Vibrio vulnificus]|nr:Mob1/phocein family protein [Vibrio vulnificus]
LYRYEYRWADGVQIKKPIEVSAPKYVEYLMDWIEAQLDDESIFPQKLGNTTLSFSIFVGHSVFLLRGPLNWSYRTGLALP